MELTEGSETSANYNLTPGKYPKEQIHYGWQVLPHPLYSPDMRPPDFDLFSKLKTPLRGKRFRSIEEVSNEVIRVIRRINNEGVLTGIQDMPKRWTAVIKHNGDYIEGL
jgi:histone-lysine N-methyltransferase SETMAR